MFRHILGIVDLIAAVILFFGFSAPDMVKIIITAIMLVKGVPSLAGDLICKIYGAVDISAAILIYFAFSVPGIANVIIVFILIFKGISSLI